MSYVLLVSSFVYVLAFPQRGSEAYTKLWQNGSRDTSPIVILFHYRDRAIMKNIHPTYYTDAKVKCACGHIFTIGSTVSQMEVDICSACHPFYTGTKKIIDVAGRVEKFQKKIEKAKELKQKAVLPKKPRAKKTAPSKSKVA